MNERVGDWLQVRGGTQMYPLDPRPDEIHIEDIAASLSKLCRFNGHTSEFYSVAEHCCYVCDILPPELKLAGLLHDASEAYLCDIPRPLKRSPQFGEMYDQHETLLMYAVAERFGFTWPMHPDIVTADNAVLSNEAAVLMAPLHPMWGDMRTPVPGLIIQCWPYKMAEWQFLRRFQQVTA